MQFSEPEGRQQEISSILANEGSKQHHDGTATPNDSIVSQKQTQLDKHQTVPTPSAISLETPLLLPSDKPVNSNTPVPDASEKHSNNSPSGMSLEWWMENAEYHAMENGAAPDHGTQNFDDNQELALELMDFDKFLVDLDDTDPVFNDAGNSSGNAPSALKTLLADTKRAMGQQVAPAAIGAGPGNGLDTGFGDSLGDKSSTDLANDRQKTTQYQQKPNSPLSNPDSRGENGATDQALRFATTESVDAESVNDADHIPTIENQSAPLPKHILEGIVPYIERQFHPGSIPSHGFIDSPPESSIEDFQTNLVADNKWCKNSTYGKPNDRGFINIHSSGRPDLPGGGAAKIDWSGLSDSVQRPTLTDAEAFLEQQMSNPPSKPIPYFGGNATAANSGSPLPAPLQAGRLASCEEIDVATREYYHVGARGSATAFHREDARFRSLNIVEYGYKVWLLVEPSSTTTFERFVRDTWVSQCTECEQFVRHLAIIVAPSKLRANGIEVQVRVTGPREFLMIKPVQYHAVINYSGCVARSINFVLQNEELIPQGGKVCSDCGLWPLPEEYGLVKVKSMAEIDSDAMRAMKTSPNKKSECGAGI